MEILIWLVIVSLIGAAIGQARARTAAGFWWGFLLGPIGWLIVLLGPNPKKEQEDAQRREQEIRMQKVQEAHLIELRALRDSIAATPKKPAIREDEYWVRLKDRDVGPIGKLELIELYSAGKITLETQVAREEPGDRVYRLLGDEISALKNVR